MNKKIKKAPTQKQKDARAKFKKATERAKQIRSKNPNIKWSDAVKKAFTEMK